VKAPNDVNAHILMAQVQLMDKQRDDALKSINAAISADPSSARAHLLAGGIYAQADRTDQAVQEYEKVLGLEPRPLVPTLLLARLYLGRGNIDKSLSYVQQALTIDPGNADAEGLMVRMDLVRGETQKAKELQAGLQKRYPNVPATFDLMGLVQLSEKHVDAARTAYVKALQLNSYDIEALGQLVRIDLATGHVAEAKARLDGIVALADPPVDLLLLAARGYASVNDLSTTETVLKRAIDADPTRLQGYALLGQLYARQRRTDEAIAEFQDVVKREPKSVSAMTMIGMLMEAQGHRDTAEKQYEAVMAVDSRAVVAANNLAWLYASAKHKLDEALQLAQTAQQQMPGEPSISDTLGWIYVQKNMPARAIEPLETSVEKVPANPVFQYHLGMAYMQTGDFDKAKRFLTKALSLNPSFEGAADARKALASIGA
jgi:tetratricopeptide (TPR) repeat protein